MLPNPHAAVTPLTELYNTKNAHRGTQPKLFTKATTVTIIISLLTFLDLCHPSPYHPQMTISQLLKYPRDSPCSGPTAPARYARGWRKPSLILSVPAAGGLFIMAPSTNASMAKDRHCLIVEIDRSREQGVAPSPQAHH